MKRRALRDSVSRVLKKGNKKLASSILLFEVDLTRFSKQLAQSLKCLGKAKQNFKEQRERM